MCLSMAASIVALPRSVSRTRVPRRSAGSGRRSIIPAQRVSVGGALTWVAARALADAATAIREHGDFSALAARVPLDQWFGRNNPIDSEEP